MTCGATTWPLPTTWRQGASPAGCTWPSAPSTISGWTSSTFHRCGIQDGTSQGRVRGGGRSWPPAQPVPQREPHHNLLHRPAYQQVRGELVAFQAGRFSIIILLAKRKTDTQNFYCTSLWIDCSPETWWKTTTKINIVIPHNMTWPFDGCRRKPHMFNTLNVRGQGMLTGQGDRADVDLIHIVEKIWLLMLSLISCIMIVELNIGRKILCSSLRVPCLHSLFWYYWHCHGYCIAKESVCLSWIFFGFQQSVTTSKVPFWCWGYIHGEYKVYWTLWRKEPIEELVMMMELTMWYGRSGKGGG